MRANGSENTVLQTHPAVNQMEHQVEVPQMAQSDRLAKMPESRHPDTY
jgi:hypothetical protein